jgi:hypothetical protein
MTVTRDTDSDAISVLLTGLIESLDQSCFDEVEPSTSWLNNQDGLKIVEARLEGWSTMLARLRDRMDSIDQELADSRSGLLNWLDTGRAIQKKWSEPLPEPSKLN